MPERRTMLLIAPQGPNRGAEGMVTLKFVSMLRSHGWRVIWLFQDDTREYPAGGGEDPDFIAVKAQGGHLLSRCLDKLSLWLNKRFLGNQAWCMEAFYRASQIIGTEHIDILSSRIMPKFGHLPALFLCRRHRLPWHVNWSDPLPHYRAPAPYGTGPGTSIKRLDRWYLASICRLARFHTFPSERLRRYFLQYLPARPDRCHVIPHIADKKSAPPMIEGERLTMAYVGGGLAQRNPELFFQALAQIRPLLQASGIILEVRFIGPVEEASLIACRRHGVEDLVAFERAVSYEQALDAMSSSSINLVLEAPVSEGIFLPSKLADIVGCGRPVFAISPNEGVLHDLLEEYDGGLFADCRDAESIRQGLETLIRDWKEHRFSSSRYSVDSLRELFCPDAVWHSFSSILDAGLRS